jgi:hypothetical protein
MTYRLSKLPVTIAITLLPGADSMTPSVSDLHYLSKSTDAAFTQPSAARVRVCLGCGYCRGL